MVENRERGRILDTLLKDDLENLESVLSYLKSSAQSLEANVGVTLESVMSSKCRDLSFVVQEKLKTQRSVYLQCPRTRMVKIQRPISSSEEGVQQIELKNVEIYLPPPEDSARCLAEKRAWWRLREIIQEATGAASTSSRNSSESPEEVKKEVSDSDILTRSEMSATTSAASRASSKSSSERASSELNKAGLQALSVRRNPFEPILQITQLSFPPGSKTLISGPTGAGKSTLMRALAGIWPYLLYSNSSDDSEEGYIRIPAKSQCMFVPRATWLPSGSLRSLVSYPDLPGRFSDHEIVAVLHEVGLGKLVESNTSELTDDDKVYNSSKAGSSEITNSACLDVDETWSRVLSGGEQNRIVLAQCLLHKPRVIFLDEAIANMNRESGYELYTKISKMIEDLNGILISISHDVMGMKDFHNRHLKLDVVGKRLVVVEGWE